MKSIIQADREHCFICRKNAKADYFGLDEHHVYFGSNRKKSERYGLKVYICHDSCHLSGVHKNAELCRKVQAVVQKRAMQYYGWTVDKFREIFGRNYLESEE
jgi:hypothetical protein